MKVIDEHYDHYHVDFVKLLWSKILNRFLTLLLSVLVNQVGSNLLLIEKALVPFFAIYLEPLKSKGSFRKVCVMKENNGKQKNDGNDTKLSENEANEKRKLLAHSAHEQMMEGSALVSLGLPHDDPSG